MSVIRLKKAQEARTAVEKANEKYFIYFIKFYILILF